MEGVFVDSHMDSTHVLFHGHPCQEPDVPTHVVLCRNDRLLPAAWLRGVVRGRLGIEPDELACGHTPALSRPRELVELIESYRSPAASA